LVAGVVPRRGLQFIQVGRQREVEALRQDLDALADGGSFVRFVIGPYGSGKSYMLELTRSIALELGFVTVGADLTPDRRLYSTRGHGRALYAELMRNLSTRSHPEGGGLAAVVEMFVARAIRESEERGCSVESVIDDRLAHLRELVGGYELAEVLKSYWDGHDRDDEFLKRSALRWLRAEYTAKTDARADLGVRRIIDDSNFYDSLKLFAQLVRCAGYQGLVVCLDEAVNLFQLRHKQARQSNYERLLAIVNDALQGNSEHLGLLVAGTPDFLTDPEKGLYSYDALKTRLSENPFAQRGREDLAGPVMRLTSLGRDEFLVLLKRIRHVQAAGDPERYLMPDTALAAFMDDASRRFGVDFFSVPRMPVKSFVQFLSLLEQHPEASWERMLREPAVVR
ncbi:MAG: ATP-binding protein, partial [Longimicrobiales bacterium]|nr:ATP-binding protein [Longimicrobiales bacterium]